MDQINWLEVLGWKEDHLNEIRMLGFAMLQQGHYKKAAVYFEGLAFIDSKSAYDYRILGALYLQMDINDKALEILNRALELDPTNDGARLNKAKALFMLGNVAEGISTAKSLQTSKDPRVAGDATALILCHS